MTTDTTPKEFVKRYLQAFNDRDWDALREHLAPDAVEHGIHTELHGPDEIVEFLRSHFETFPDYAGTMEAILADDDTVAVRYTATGTLSEAYRDAEPTPNPVEWTGMAMYHIEDDTIAEIWLEEDRLGMLEQVEAAEAPAHLRI